MNNRVCARALMRLAFVSVRACMCAPLAREARGIRLIFQPGGGYGWGEGGGKVGYCCVVMVVDGSRFGW